MGHADLRVGNKVFASLPNEAGRVAIKISPLGLDALVRSDPETFRNAWGGRWVGVSLARVSRGVLRDLLHDAWRMTAPTSVLRAAGAVARPPARGKASRRQAGKSPER